MIELILHHPGADIEPFVKYVSRRHGDIGLSTTFGNITSIDVTCGSKKNIWEAGEKWHHDVINVITYNAYRFTGNNIVTINLPVTDADTIIKIIEGARQQKQPVNLINGYHYPLEALLYNARLAGIDDIVDRVVTHYLKAKDAERRLQELYGPMLSLNDILTNPSLTTFIPFALNVETYVNEKLPRFPIF